MQDFLISLTEVQTSVRESVKRISNINAVCFLPLLSIPSGGNIPQKCFYFAWPSIVVVAEPEEVTV